MSSDLPIALRIVSILLLTFLLNATPNQSQHQGSSHIQEADQSSQQFHLEQDKFFRHKDYEPLRGDSRTHSILMKWFTTRIAQSKKLKAYEIVLSSSKEAKSEIALKIQQIKDELQRNDQERDEAVKKRLDQISNERSKKEIRRQRKARIEELKAEIMQKAEQQSKVQGTHKARVQSLKKVIAQKSDQKYGKQGKFGKQEKEKQQKIMIRVATLRKSIYRKAINWRAQLDPILQKKIMTDRVKKMQQAVKATLQTITSNYQSPMFQDCEQSVFGEELFIKLPSEPNWSGLAIIPTDNYPFQLQGKSIIHKPSRRVCREIKKETHEHISSVLTGYVQSVTADFKKRILTGDQSECRQFHSKVEFLSGDYASYFSSMDTYNYFCLLYNKYCADKYKLDSLVLHQNGRQYPPVSDPFFNTVAKTLSCSVDVRNGKMYAFIQGCTSEEQVVFHPGLLSKASKFYSHSEEVFYRLSSLEKWKCCYKLEGASLQFYYREVGYSGLKLQISKWLTKMTYTQKAQKEGISRSICFSLKQVSESILKQSFPIFDDRLDFNKLKHYFDFYCKKYDFYQQMPSYPLICSIKKDQDQLMVRWKEMTYWEKLPLFEVSEWNIFQQFRIDRQMRHVEYRLIYKQWVICATLNQDQKAFLTQHAAKRAQEHFKSALDLALKNILQFKEQSQTYLNRLYSIADQHEKLTQRECIYLRNQMIGKLFPRFNDLDSQRIKDSNRLLKLFNHYCSNSSTPLELPPQRENRNIRSEIGQWKMPSYSQVEQQQRKIDEDIKKHMILQEEIMHALGEDQSYSSPNTPIGYRLINLRRRFSTYIRNFPTKQICEDALDVLCRIREDRYVMSTKGAMDNLLLTKQYYYKCYPFYPLPTIEAQRIRLGLST